MWPSRMTVEPRVQRWLFPFPVLKQVAHSLASFADSLGVFGNEKKDLDSRQSLKDVAALKFHSKSLLLLQRRIHIFSCLCFVVNESLFQSKLYQQSTSLGTQTLKFQSLLLFYILSERLDIIVLVIMCSWPWGS